MAACIIHSLFVDGWYYTRHRNLCPAYDRLYDACTIAPITGNQVGQLLRVLRGLQYAMCSTAMAAMP